MKIAVTSVGRGLEDRVDRRFGRCPYFVVADTMTLEIDAVENEGMSKDSGAGLCAARQLTECEVDAVVTGQCGPKAFRALHAAGMGVFTGADGSVIEAIERYVADELTPAPEGTVRSHSGANESHIVSVGEEK